MVLCWVALGTHVTIEAYGCCCLLRARHWPRAGVPRLDGNQVKKPKGRKGLLEWFKMLLRVWSWKEGA